MKQSAMLATKTRYFLVVVLILLCLLPGIIAPAAAVAAPVAPANLTATKISSGQIDLTWADNSNNELGFHIETATNEAFTTGQVTFTVSPNVTAYSDTSVYAGATFYYKVTSFDATGDSAPSNVASVNIPLPTASVPAAPTGLTAVAVSATQVNVTWVDNSANEVGFLVERAGDAGFTIGLASYTVGPDIYVYSDQTTSAGMIYFYRVTAYNALGSSTSSAPATATTPGTPPPTGTPAAPNGLTAVAANATQVNLTWADNSSDETGFRIERAADAAFTSGLTTFSTAVNSTTYADSSVAAATSYHYRLFAFNTAGDSAASESVMVTTPAPTAMPAAPSGLTAVADIAEQVDLTWTDNSGDEISFRIERATDSGFTVGKVTFTVAANLTTFTDTTTAANNVYYYRIYALNAHGDSSPSNNASVTTPGTTAASIAAPGSLAANAVSANQVDLTWTDNSATETSFRIDRAGNSSFTSGLVSFSAAVNTTAYSDTSAAAAATYCYRVIAVSAAGNSTSSNIATVNTPALSGNPIPTPVPTPTPTPAPAGGNTAPTAVTLSGLSAKSSPRVDRSGMVEKEVQLASPDSRVMIDITASTKLLDAQGKPLAAISQTTVASPPAAPVDRLMVLAVNLGPDGARFEPAITLTMKYNPQSLPAGIIENELQIAQWDGARWQIIEGTVNTATQTVSARISHFCQFAIMGRKAAAAAPAGFSISGLNVTPANCFTSESVSVAVMVSNNSAGAGDYNITMKINGVQEGNQIISLGAGEKRIVGFSTRKDTPGTYKVEVNGLSSLFIVEAGKSEPAPAPAAPVPASSTGFNLDWKIILAIFGGVILVGWLFYMMDKQRRQD